MPDLKRNPLTAMLKGFLGLWAFCFVQLIFSNINVWRLRNCLSLSILNVLNSLMINRAYNDFFTIKELRKVKGLFPQITLIPAEFTILAQVQ